MDELRDDSSSEAGFLINATDAAYVLDEPAGALPALHRLKSNTLGMIGTRNIMAIEDSGQRVLVDTDVPRDAVAALLQTFLVSPQGSGRLEVRSWNGNPVMETDGEAILSAIGFRREYPVMIYDAVQARVSSRARNPS